MKRRCALTVMPDTFAAPYEDGNPLKMHKGLEEGAQDRGKEKGAIRKEAIDSIRVQCKGGAGKGKAEARRQLLNKLRERHETTKTLDLKQPL